jgi:hypothetical protein
VGWQGVARGEALLVYVLRALVCVGVGGGELAPGQSSVQYGGLDMGLRLKSSPQNSNEAGTNAARARASGHEALSRQSQQSDG